MRGTTAVLIYTRAREHGFGRTTAVLDQLGLDIVDARITPTGDGFSLDLYHVLADDGAPLRHAAHAETQSDGDDRRHRRRKNWRNVSGIMWKRRTAGL